MNIPIITNHSVSHFKSCADEIAEGLRKAGHNPIIMNNVEAWRKIRAERYSKCVFLDKDIALGLTMEVSGTRLFNNIGSIELCNDKRRTHALIANDFPVPETLIYPLTYFANEAFFLSFANEVCDRLGLPLVAKLACGSQGREVFLLSSKNEVLDFQRKYYGTPHLYQKFITSSKGKDMRVYVVGGEVVAAMNRINGNDFRSNIAMGGNAEKAEPTEEIKTLCTDLASLLALDFCGIDLLFAPDGMMVCEVNSSALFVTINNVCDVKIGYKIAERAASFDSQM